MVRDRVVCVILEDTTRSMDKATFFYAYYLCYAYGQSSGTDNHGERARGNDDECVVSECTHVPNVDAFGTNDNNASHTSSGFSSAGMFRGSLIATEGDRPNFVDSLPGLVCVWKNGGRQ